MSSPRSCFSNSRNVASRRVAAFFIFRSPVDFLRRCIVLLLLPLPHRATAVRAELLAAPREDQGRAATTRRYPEEQVARLLARRLGRTHGGNQRGRRGGGRA